MLKVGKNKKAIKSNALHSMLTGIDVDRAGTREVAKSSIKFAIYEKTEDEQGKEVLVEVKK